MYKYFFLFLFCSLLFFNSSAQVSTGVDTSKDCECENEYIIEDMNPVEGYLNHDSYRPGDSIILYAHSLLPNVQMSLVQYGALTTKTVIGTVAVEKQMYTNCSFKYGCKWKPAAVLRLPQGTASGYYSIELKTDSASFFIPFIVKAPVPGKNKILVVASTSTWQAYNEWGGASFYRFRNQSSCPIKFTSTVNFMRPNTSVNLNDDVVHLFKGELHLIRWLSQMGYSFDVVTDLELHENPYALNAYKVVILNTHDEYVTKEMVNNVQQFIARGGNVMSLASNNYYWKVTIKGSAMEVRKYSDTHKQTGEKGGQWRNLGAPESGYLGVQYDTRGVRSYCPYRVLAADHWIYAGTNVKNGDLFGTCTLTKEGASGHETDKRTPYTPKETTLLAKGINPSKEGVTDSLGGAEMVLVEVPGKGKVFSVGSMVYNSALQIDAVISRITQNVIDRFTK
jgi:hypothetical protein